MNDKTNKSDAPTFIGAKASRFTSRTTRVASLAGDVIMRQGSMQVEADEANLYPGREPWRTVPATYASATTVR